jgi:hypothetical protein
MEMASLSASIRKVRITRILFFSSDDSKMLSSKKYSPVFGLKKHHFSGE